MKVHWTDGARADLRAIRAYVAGISPEYADRLIHRILQRSEQISQFPLSGTKIRRFRLGQIREVYEQKYRIIYFVSPDDVQVLAVMHTSINQLREE